MDDALKKAFENMNDPIRKALETMESNPMNKALEAIEKFRPTIEQYQLPELRMPTFHVPDMHEIKFPTQEEVNEYQSAGTLIKRIADSISQWRKQLPNEQQPAILAILNGGIQIRVQRLVEETFHGIRIEGKIGDNPCMILAHQATVQLICYIEKVEEENSQSSIGFIYDGKEQQV